MLVEMLPKVYQVWVFWKEKAVQCDRNNLVSENINVAFCYKGYCMDMVEKNADTITEYTSNQLKENQLRKLLILKSKTLFESSR